MYFPDLKTVTNIWNNIRFSMQSKPYSILVLVMDPTNWSTNWDQKELMKTADALHIKHHSIHGPGVYRQSVFYNSKYIFLNPNRYLIGKNRVGLPYFHGNPSSGDETAIGCYKGLEKYHERIDRVQVSHSAMHDIVLESGIAPSKVYRIPIAVNPDYFSVQTEESKRTCRQMYNIPRDAVVVGSFQKDGNGWDEGNTPKWIKGPDVFLKAVEILKESIPELFVLLSGPARGYVKNGLEKLKIPYTHIYLDHYPDIHRLYQCLDLYIISSREEGGPKAVLESMISGIPLATTRVGQAIDLVDHEKNACMVESEDAEGLSFWAEKIVSDGLFRNTLIQNGLKTANENTYVSHIPLWKSFFDGFVRPV